MRNVLLLTQHATKAGSLFRNCIDTYLNCNLKSSRNKGAQCLADQVLVDRCTLTVGVTVQSFGLPQGGDLVHWKAFVPVWIKI
jgi:hypothetical protein